VEAFVDSSVLVAAFQADDVRHKSSVAILNAYSRSKISTAGHSLAETYSTLTAWPGIHRVTPEAASLYLADQRQQMTIVNLDEEEIWASIEASAKLGLRSGMVYDGLIAACARKAAAKSIYTWNRKHFERLGPEIAKRVKEPGR
jgi:predicted nucleic acid-binding protein